MNWDVKHPSYKKELGHRLLSVQDRFPTKTAAAEAAGVTPEQFSKWTGQKNGIDIPKVPVSALLGLANAASIDFNWLATGESLKHAEQDADSSKTIASKDFWIVPRYNASASAGNGSFVDYAEKLDEIPFTEDFMLKRLGRTKTDGLILVDAAGDSMEPTISDGDLIMIDTDKKQLTAAIYAFTYEDSFYVKRLNNLPDAIKATSDNKEYDPFVIEREQMNRVDILGRVVWVGHTP